MFKSRNMLALVSAILLAIPLIAACGGGDDGGNGNPTRTATSPGSNNGGGETPDPNGGGQTEPYSETVEVFIPPSQFQTRPVNLAEGDELKLTVKTRSSVVGAGDTGGQNRGRIGVVMAVNNPLDEQLLLTEQIIDHEDQITADIAGQYEVIFQNPFPLEAMIVNLTYSVNQ
jgi:hypothetical protein